MGCGSGYKLMHMFGNFETTGIELAETCHWLKLNYPGKKWLEFENTDPGQLKTDMIICSDVIEHVPNPDGLMDFLGKIDIQVARAQYAGKKPGKGKNGFRSPGKHLSLPGMERY